MPGDFANATKIFAKTKIFAFQKDFAAFWLAIRFVQHDLRNTVFI